MQKKTDDGADPEGERRAKEIPGNVWGRNSEIVEMTEGQTTQR